MIYGPRVDFQCAWHPILLLLEAIIPGAEVYGWTGRQWHRPKPGATMPVVAYGQVRIALHSAWRVEEELRGAGVSEMSTTSHGVDAVRLDLTRAQLLDYGWQVVFNAVQRGELRPDALAKGAPHQFRIAAKAATRPWYLQRWSAGGGKTLGACMAFLSRPGGVLVIVPAKARKEWKRSKHSTIGTFTELDPFCLLPMSERRAQDEELPAYLERCRQQGLRPIVVVGMEALSTYTAELAQFHFTALHIDELHELGSSAIFRMQANQDGTSRPVSATTAGGEVPRAVAAYNLTRRSSVVLRGAATATPLDDGATKRMWGPLGLLSPGGFGRLGAFTGRYSNAQRIDGYWNTDGASHVPELRQRCSFIFDDVPRRESHAGLQQRIQVTYLSPPGTGKPEKDWTVQNRPDAFTAELKAAERAARQTGGHVARMKVRECRLAEAASRKRVAIRTRHAEFHADGQKTVVLMTRREMVEQWAAEWREAFPELPAWAIHGDTPQDERDAALDTFREVQGAAWIIGTGYAIGTGVNGMQFAHLLTIAQLPEKPGPLIQWVGRGDRMDGVGTLIWLPVAEGTQDDIEVARIIRKCGPIEKLLDVPELREMADLMEGDSDELEDSIIEKLLKGGGTGDED